MEDKLTIKDDNGNEKEYDVMFTFESEETNKIYVTYTDYSKDEEGNIKVYSLCYDKDDKNRKLQEVTTEKELNTIDEILKSITDDVKND